MHWTTLGAFAALDLVLCFVPGPAVMTVVGAALSRDRLGFATALGILTGNAVYFVVTALGIASLILASHSAFVVVKLCGAAYLAFLGIRSLITKEADARVATAPDARDITRGWALGTITQLANPKALVFFAAIVPQFIDPRASLVPQVVILGVASLVIELGVLSTYIGAAERIRRRGIAPKSYVWAERAGGLCLLGVAAAVAHEPV
jgi:threonine/homoserine/homoserine lactone efflux protein